MKQMMRGSELEKPWKIGPQTHLEFVEGDKNASGKKRRACAWNLDFIEISPFHEKWGIGMSLPTPMQYYKTKLQMKPYKEDMRERIYSLLALADSKLISHAFHLIARDMCILIFCFSIPFFFSFLFIPCSFPPTSLALLHSQLAGVRFLGWGSKYFSIPLQ